MRAGEVEGPEAIGDDTGVDGQGEEGGGGGGDGRQLGQVEPGPPPLNKEIETCCDAKNNNEAGEEWINTCHRGSIVSVWTSEIWLAGLTNKQKFMSPRA